MSTKKSPFKTIVGNEKSPEAYISYGGTGGIKKYEDSTRLALEASVGVSRGSVVDNFQSLRPGISGRPGFTRDTYEYFRPEESLPRRYKETVLVCDNMYYNVTLIRNVIDLMSDFACQGIKLVHPIKSQERFYNAWFNKVCGFDRSERFLNYLYRHATVVVETRVGTIDIIQERELSQAGEIKIEKRKTKSREIPLQYIFHHPALVDPKNNVNSDKVIYNLTIVDTSNPNFDQISPMNLTGKTRILPPDKTFVYHFKKDDWQVKPIPFLYSLVKHAIMLEKLYLADSAALDGAISAVRIFKLGDVEYKIAATEAAVAKMDEILQSHVGGGTLDIIWPGPIELIESKTDVHNFLGESKYAPCLEQIYIGLGIPPTLAGKGGSGTTNNYISLKTLTKRLQYGRRLLLNFWEEQIRWVQKSMNFAKPAKIEFDILDLGDEQAEKALLIQLADRNLISDEKLQSIFGYDSEMEKARLNRESRERKSGRRVERATALNDPFMASLKKIALQKGYVSIEQLGIEVEEGTEGQKTPFKEQMDVAKKQAKTAQVSTPQKGKSSRGRPSGAKDSKKRTRVFRPKIKAALDIWVDDAQEKINEISKGQFLKLVNKSNFRQLTQKEVKQYERLSFGVISNIEPFTEITKEVIVAALAKPIRAGLYQDYIDYKTEISKELARDLTLEETKKIKSIIYSSIYEEK